MELKDFTKYFNYGYFLSKYEPSFLKKLINATGDNSEISESLKAGKSQFNKEQFFDKLRGISKSSTKSKEKGHEPEM